MGIEVASSFTRKAAVPIDDLFVVANQAARDAIPSGVRYEGMFCYVIADALNYQLVTGIANINWAPFAGGGGGGSTPIVNTFDGNGGATYGFLTADPVTKDNTLVYLNGQYIQKAEYSLSGTGASVNVVLTFNIDSLDKLEVIIGSTSMIAVPSIGSVVTASIADGAVTYEKLAARSGFNNPAAIGEIARSASSSGFFHQDTSQVDVTNLSVTITTKGGPVELMLVDDGSLSSSDITVLCSAAGFPNAWINFYRDSTQLTHTQIGNTISATYPIQSKYPASSFKHIDDPAAGTHTYKVTTSTGSAATTGIGIGRCKLIAREL